MNKSFLLFLLLSISEFTFGQSKKSIGFDYSYNFTSNKLSGNPGSPHSMSGLIFNFKKSRWVGFETGLLYRTYRDDLVLGLEPYYFSVDVRQKFITIPILYKVSTKVLNVSIGTTIDYCYEVKSYIFNKFYTFPEGETPNYYLISLTEIVKYNNPYQNISFGIIGKLSKEIQISKQFDIEPQLRISHNFTKNKNYNGLGLGLSVKYKF